MCHCCSVDWTTVTTTKPVEMKCPVVAACSCSPLGTVDRQTSCSQVTGQCPCLPNVSERDCSACQPGYFNLQSGSGCKRSEALVYLSCQVIPAATAAKLHSLCPPTDVTVMLLALPAASVTSPPDSVSVSLASPANTANAARSTFSASVLLAANVSWLWFYRFCCVSGFAVCQVLLSHRSIAACSGPNISLCVTPSLRL